ncbi:MAG: caspase family protein, partial [Chitinophagaceae bacterium]|nr:caspase family protein [Chitinophagaceae bacterium]
MQRTLFFGITILLMLCTVSSFAQKKIALIIAVGKYDPNQRDWKNLNAHRDLIYIREALQKNGFASNNIDTLRDAQATKAAMIKALDALAKKAAKGDIVYFHFSGHGQQIQDSKTDGILDEADGYDEALIPYDAKGKWDQVDYKGEKHFRDDLLAEKLLAIRKNVGEQGSVVVVIDACHSGTATRSAGIVRGDPVPLQQYNYKPNVVIDLSKNPEVGLLENMGTDMGSLVVFSGSSPNQVNRETKDDKGNNVGSLSYAFAKAITSLPANCNYQLLFQKIKATIQADEPTQIP